VKRLLDLVLVVVTAPVWIPVLGALLLLVRVTLGRPVLFRQTRPGLGARPFTLVKLRTMTDASDATGRLLPDADRLTSFGRWLRATSLDELPELWNVLRGDMSLVGPRPLLVEYLPLYTPAQSRRHAVRPGITGLAQISGRNAISWEEKFRLDTWYVDHHSLTLDLKILMLTCLRVVQRHGIAAAGDATMPRFAGASAPPPPSTVAREDGVDD
jgi:lipopolysaccharide/colanic/teichoic acid biosynthesis glycosyltransferase